MEDTLCRFNELQNWQDICPAPEVLTRMAKSTLPGTPLPEPSCMSYKGNGHFVLPLIQPLPASSNINKGKNREF